MGKWEGEVGGKATSERSVTPWPLLEGETAPCAWPGANRRWNRRPAMPRHLPAGPGHSGLTAASLPVSPFHLPKLLREEDKEKYADMAREWRAAQGKDGGPSEKQVKFSRDQQPPGPRAHSTNAG